MAGSGDALRQDAPEGLRLCLLKLGVWVRSSTRRVVLSLPREAPYVSEWLQIARNLGAVPT